MLGSLHAKTWQYKLRPGLKIDAGMYFSDIKQLQKVYFKPNEHFFMYDVRQFNFYKKGRVLIPYFTAPPNRKMRVYSERREGYLYQRRQARYPSQSGVTSKESIPNDIGDCTFRRKTL